MEYTAAYQEIMLLIPGLLSGIPSGLFGLACYVLSAYAIYTIAQRRCLSKPWLAWIPVVNCWLLGSLSDQYRYVVKGQNKSKRKILLTLSIVTLVLGAGMAASVVVMVVKLLNMTTAQSVSSVILAQMLSILGTALPMSAAAIAFAVIRYMALYDVYRSLDPDNAILFLVLSIVFSPTEPFFLFFNRDKDTGMPPRRPQAAPSQPQAPEYHARPNTAVEDAYIDVPSDGSGAEFL